MKRKIKAGLPDNQLQFFLLSSKEFQNLDWVNHKEFKRNGTMYDVVRTETLKNDSVKLACINDSKETELFAHLNEHIDSFSDIQKDGKGSTKLLLKLLKIQAITEVNKSVFKLIFIPILHKETSAFYTNIFVKETAQPPEARQCT